MRVLVLTSFPPAPSPEADFALRLCERLGEAGVEVNVLTTRGSAAPARRNLTVLPLIDRWSWAALPVIAATAGRLQPDAVLLSFVNWVFDFHAMITFAPTLLRRVLPRAPFVTILHNADAYPVDLQPSRRYARRLAEACAGHEGLDPLYGALFRDSDRLLASGEGSSAAVLARAPGAASRLETLHIPPLLQFAEGGAAGRGATRRALGIREDEFVLGNFGYLYGGKGLWSLTEAFALLLQRRGRERLRLLLVGGDLEEERHEPFREAMRARVRALGLQDRILRSGHWAWDSDRGSRWLYAADACALPFEAGAGTRHCSISTVLAHGRPLVTTHGPFSAPHFVDGVNALLVPPNDGPALADAIERLIDDPALAQRLALGGAALERRCFSWDAVVGATLSALQAPRARGGPPVV